jgi:predicted aconitase
MTLSLTADETAMAEGRDGPAVAIAMRILAEMGRLVAADRLIPIASVHVDGCLYHGDSGVHFAERLQRGRGRVRVPTTLNVGALDLLHPGRVRASPHRRDMALRLMQAYEALGCRPTWTCAPYQAGHRPRAGEDVAWGESNAVAFCNSVLGARTNRYGDFLDVCAALTGRAPCYGLHRPENRRARILVDAGILSRRLVASDVFYPVLGSWLGAEVGDAVAVIDGLPPEVGEDQLKALGAAASSSGAVGLFHVVGVTPEAPSAAAALGGAPPERRIVLTPAMLRAARDRLSTTGDGRIDAVALGSPHFSLEEFGTLLALLRGRRSVVPFYVCTSRHVVEALRRDDRLQTLDAAGVTVVADTCVVVTPILPEAAEGTGVLMTNSGKFAHYAPANTGYHAVYGSLEDCVASAVAGRVVRDEGLWQ